MRDPGKRHEIWRLSNDGLMAPLLYDRRETGDGGRVEELAQRQLNLIGIAHSIQHLKRDQRFSAQFKEVLVNADSFDTKDLLPDGREGLLKFMSRSDIRGREGRPGMLPGRGGSSAGFLQQHGAGTRLWRSIFVGKILDGCRDLREKQLVENSVKDVAAFRTGHSYQKMIRHPERLHARLSLHGHPDLLPPIPVNRHGTSSLP